jgi:hypothetical protein
MWRSRAIPRRGHFPAKCRRWISSICSGEEVLFKQAGTLLPIALMLLPVIASCGIGWVCQLLKTQRH